METAHQTVTFSGSLEYVADISLQYKSEGYTVKEATRTTHWPYFWIKSYTVTMTRILIPNHEYDCMGRVISFNYSLGLRKPEQLTDQLKEAIENEDYEQAARLRDMINGQ